MRPPPHLTPEEALALRLRRDAFVRAIADARVHAALAARVPSVPSVADCPCCGYPTLSERGAYDICKLCGWEDDGQDDADAGDVWGGPNGDYSLTEARRNFIDHTTQYRPGSRGFTKATKAAAARRELIAAFDALLPEVDAMPFVDGLLRLRNIRS